MSGTPERPSTGQVTRASDAFAIPPARLFSPVADSLLSELRKVMWHFSLELGEVARDRRHVEASENRFLRLTVEQEPEGRFETALRRVLARRQPLAHLSRHRDVVMGLALSFSDDHLENERVVLGSASNLDHVDFLGDARIFLSRVCRG